MAKRIDREPTLSEIKEAIKNRPKSKRIDREGPIHRAVVDYLHRVLPRSAFIHHSRNEGNRGGLKGAVDGKRGRAMGILAGFPDLILFSGGKV